VPHWEELLHALPRPVVPDRRHYKIHAKCVTPVNTEELKKLMDGRLAEQWKVVSRILNDPSWYAGVKITKQERKKFYARLSSSHLTEFKDAGYLEVLAGEPLGCVHMFLVPEDHKTRFRVIAHTLTVNTILNFQRFALPRIEEIRGAMQGASHGISMDMAAWFHQFELDETVRDYFATTHNKRKYRLTRLPMGTRSACAVAQTAAMALTLRAARLNVKIFIYIDNILILGSEEAVAAAREAFTQDCAAVGAQINEFDPTPSTTIEYCGMQLDLLEKTIDVSQRTIDKAKVLFDCRDQWTNRLFAGFMATLAFITRVRQGSLAHIYETMHSWRTVHYKAQREPECWDDSFVIPTSLYHQLHEFYTTTAAPKPTKVNFRRPVDSILLVDACEKGWGAIHISKEGVIRCGAGEATNAKWKHSSVSEPWGWYFAVRNLVRDGDACLVLSDNEALKHTVASKCARAWDYNETIRRTLDLRPHSQIDVEHFPGECNLADKLSRGESCAAGDSTHKKFQTWCTERMTDLPITDQLKTALGSLAASHIPYRKGIHALACGVRKDE